MTTDYARDIDAETWAFIDRVNAFYPSDAVNWPIMRSREVYDRMCRAFHTGYPAGVTAETSAISTRSHSLPIRIYSAAKTNSAVVVVYFHGGGFILGGLDSHDDICADICAHTGFTAVSVDYRLAPEYLGTAAFEDAVAAYRWAAASFSRPVILVGESAGGNLAACVASHAGASSGQIAGQVLIYPLLGSDTSRGTYVTHSEAPLLSTQDAIFYRDLRTGGVHVADDPRYSPLACQNFSDLPPTVIFTAECDPLSSDGQIYCRLMLSQGARAFWQEEAGLPHGYLRARNISSRAAASFARLNQAIANCGHSRWPMTL